MYADHPAQPYNPVKDFNAADERISQYGDKIIFPLKRKVLREVLAHNRESMVDGFHLRGRERRKCRFLIQCEPDSVFHWNWLPAPAGWFCRTPLRHGHNAVFF